MQRRSFQVPESGHPITISDAETGLALPTAEVGVGGPGVQSEESIVKIGALQSAIFNSANFSSIATDAKGVIQIFNVGAERMLGYAASEVMNTITPADIS
ncbi:MAG: PAS domain-containing protein, partial [Brevundimonas sp.]|uniref:PAS domain-containing protein n=1 Tax=Brevundimonas sp. TaxID=1871086 RepID=UPI002ABC9EF7